MLKAGVTIACALALLGACSLVIGLRRTRRTPTPIAGGEPFRERLATTTARAGGMLVGAMVSGVLTIGAGGRLLMRVLAVTSGDDAQGAVTEADEVVGRVTVAGSLFLILALGAAAGLAGLVVFAALRRWLPDRSVTAGLLGAAIGAGLLVRPTGLIAADNSDFALLDPAPLAVAWCLAVIVTFGATFGVLVDHLAPRWPRPAWSVTGVLSVLPFVVLALSPPVLLAAVTAVLVGTVLAAGSHPVARGTDAGPAGAEGGHRGGRVLVTIAGAMGAVSVLTAAGQVFVD